MQLLGLNLSFCCAMSAFLGKFKREIRFYNFVAKMNLLLGSYLLSTGLGASDRAVNGDSALIYL